MWGEGMRLRKGFKMKHFRMSPVVIWVTQLLARILAMCVLVGVTTGCAGRRWTGPVVQTWRGNAPEVCAVVERDQGDTPHAHLTVFARVERGWEPGDVLNVDLMGHVVRFPLSDAHAVATLTWPGGFGSHSVKLRLERADGRVVWWGEDRSMVLDCDGLTTMIRPATDGPPSEPPVHP
jgi:hypothetical protein